MADIGFILLLIGFFGLCVLFVRGCERIIGPEDDSSAGGERAAEAAEAELEEVTA
jgi:hypothetical protein